jgi:hypothetical protein
MVIAQNKGLDAPAFVLEDRSVLPKENGPHAEVGMYAPGCTSLEDARIRSENTEGAATGHQSRGSPLPSDV